MSAVADSLPSSTNTLQQSPKGPIALAVISGIITTILFAAGAALMVYGGIYYSLPFLVGGASGVALSIPFLILSVFSAINTGRIIRSNVIMAQIQAA